MYGAIYALLEGSAAGYIVGSIGMAAATIALFWSRLPTDASRTDPNVARRKVMPERSKHQPAAPSVVQGLGSGRSGQRSRDARQGRERIQVIGRPVLDARPTARF